MPEHTPAECWHPENWDAVTLAWLHSPEGAADLALVKAAPDLLEALRIAEVHLGWGDCTLENVHNICRAAIAKASGNGSVSRGEET